MLHITQKQSYKSSCRHRTPQTDHVCFRIPVMISPQEFDAVQVIMQQNSHSAGARHWLTGKVTCLECGSRMYVSGQGNRLICSGRKKGSGCRNPSQNLKALISGLAAADILGNIQNITEYLPFLTNKIEIGLSEIHVYLRCSQPHGMQSVNFQQML